MRAGGDGALIEFSVGIVILSPPKRIRNRDWLQPATTGNECWEKFKIDAVGVNIFRQVDLNDKLPDAGSFMSMIRKSSSQAPQADLLPMLMVLSYLIYVLIFENICVLYFKRIMKAPQFDQTKFPESVIFKSITRIA